MLTHFDKLRRSEEGQSLVVACVALLILALGVMATINLGRTIHQRVGMQNAADSTVYSTAALEARSFNFYAFSNRAQIVHYLSAMSLQSVLSVLSFLQYLLTAMLGFVRTVDQCNTGSFCVKAACKLAEAIPIVGEVVLAIVEAIQAVDEILTEVITVIDGLLDALDAAIGRIAIPALQAINMAMYALDFVVMSATLTSTQGGSVQTLTKNDDQIAGNSATQPLQIAMGLVTSKNYEDSHWKVSMFQLPNNDYTADFNTTDEKTRAKRAMTEVTNASRYNNFLTSRTLEGEFGTSFGVIGKIFQKFIHKYGQTKLVSRRVQQTHLNDIHSTGLDASQLAQGNSLGADDLFYAGISIGPLDLGVGEDKVDGWPDPNTGRKINSPSQALKVSVWAEKNGGIHYRVARNQDGSDGQGIKHKSVGFGPLCDLRFFYAYVRDDRNDRNHPWMGITPFMNFDAKTDKAHEYGQPGSYVYLTKTYDQTTHDKAGEAGNRLSAVERKDNFKIATPTGAATLDTRLSAVQMPTLLKSGQLNVISRALTYYHRPHNWEEPPNFFNPFWRAKLDPVLLGINDIPLLGNLPGGSAVLGELVVH